MQFRPIKSPAAEFRSDKKLCKRLVRIPVYGILYKMIRSFGDKRTERLFWDAVVREFRTIAPRAKRKLEAINAASRLEDLRVPPSNRLEKLKGDLDDFYSIRINDQWRIIFKWLNGEPHAVQVVDYH
jgi:toxin HigB-1